MMTDHTDLIAELRLCHKEAMHVGAGSNLFANAADRIEALEAQLAEAERRGAEQMRERAAQSVYNWLSELLNSDEASRVLARGIRALPLTEGGE